MTDTGRQVAHAPDPAAWPGGIEQHLAEMQRLAHVGSWEWDVATDVLTCTDEALRIYGIDEPRRPITYDRVLARVHPDDRDRARDTIFGAFRTGAPFVFEHRIVRPDGSVRMLHTRGAVVKDATGKTLRLVGFSVDVTERWLASERLAQSLSLLRSTLESTDDGLLVFDRTGRVVVYNQRALELWQIPAELVERNDVRWLAEHVRDRLQDPEGFVHREEELLQDHETVTNETLAFKDGSVFERFTRPQRQGSEVVGRVCSFRDVTEREWSIRDTVFLSDASRLLASLEVERALEHIARAALVHMAEACTVSLFNGGGAPRSISVASPGVEALAGELPPTVLAGTPACYRVAGRACVAAPLFVLGSVVGAIALTAKGGRELRECALEVTDELAQRVSLALENERLHRGALDALHARDEFLAVASHELRGPIAALHVAVQTFLKTRDPAQQARLRSIIERADLRIAGLADDILDASEIRGGRLRLDLEPIDLGVVARETISRASGELARSGSTLTTQVRGPLVGTWDRHRIGQVVANLLSNAIKFGRGRPIEVVLEGDASRARLSITDHGDGIPKDRIDAIFEPFERAVADRHYGGLGLGLCIAKSIVEGLGGSIEVASEPDRVTTFTVTLPKAKEAKAA